MDLISFIRKLGLEKFGRYYGQYYGLVVNAEDPEGTGKILVNIPEVRGANGLTALASPRGIYGGAGHGMQLLPEPGDMVNITFRFGDPEYPIWSFAAYGRDEKPEEFKDLKQFGLITAGGTKILMHEEDGTFSLETKDGTKVSLDEENINLQLKDSSQIDVTEEEISITTKGGTKWVVNDSFIKAMEEHSVKGDTLKAKLQELIDAVKSLAPLTPGVTTGPAPGGTPCTPNPLDTASLTTIAADLDNILTKY